MNKKQGQQHVQQSAMFQYDLKGLVIERENSTLSKKQSESSQICHELPNKDDTNNQAQNDDNNELFSPGTTVAHTEKLQSNIKLALHMPEIETIAHKLNKVSLLTLPDSQLLNILPDKFQSQIKVELRPKKSSSSNSNNPFKNIKIVSANKKRKDPKFVPYEPYKGCVKPLLKKSKRKSTKSSTSRSSSVTKTTSKFQEIESTHKESNTKLWCRFNETIAEFEKEKSQWEEERKVLEVEQVRLRDELVKSSKHCDGLEQQLATQTQVNSELKKLLVASVGEDVQSRVQCLTEDKARMSNMIRKYSEKVDRDYEERERMGIQCDVWHSKFLASSLLIDDLAKSKAIQSRQLLDAKDALNFMLEEHAVCQKQTLQTYKLLQQVRDAFDPLCADGSHVLSSADLVTTSLTAVDQAEWLRDRLLGNLGRAVGCSNPRYDELEVHTPGEKMAMKVLDEIKQQHDAEEATTCTSVVRSPVVHRYHPNAKFEHVTVNCCGHCNGDIKVV